MIDQKLVNGQTVQWSYMLQRDLSVTLAKNRRQRRVAYGVAPHAT